MYTVSSQHIQNAIAKGQAALAAAAFTILTDPKAGLNIFYYVICRYIVLHTFFSNFILT